MNIEQVNISELRHAEYNPRTLTETDFNELKKSLKQFGFVQPLVVNSFSERRGIIIGGNQRFETAKALGMTHVPVCWIELSDLKKEQELNLRLNRNQGNWDWDKLANEFDVQFLFDVGFQKFEIPMDIEIEGFFGKEEKKEKDKDCHMVDCPKCGFNFDANNPSEFKTE